MMTLVECYICKQLISPSQLRVDFNVAPDAASGGSMRPAHSECYYKRATPPAPAAVGESDRERAERVVATWAGNPNYITITRPLLVDGIAAEFAAVRATAPAPQDDAAEVERVAEALWRSMSRPSLGIWADMLDEYKEQWRVGARATLAAMGRR